jgi:hypothetical protein
LAIGRQVAWRPTCPTPEHETNGPQKRLAGNYNRFFSGWQAE